MLYKVRLILKTFFCKGGGPVSLESLKNSVENLKAVVDAVEIKFNELKNAPPGDVTVELDALEGMVNEQNGRLTALLG